MNFFQSLATQSFLQHAVIAGLLASVGCGVMGTYVVVKRIGFLAGGIAHAVLGGMGIAYFFGSSPLGGAVIAAIIAALLIGWVNLHWRENEDTIIAALWSVGMAIGVIFISKTPGYNVDLMSYLFGNILMVDKQSLFIMVILDSILMLTVLGFYKYFMVVCFDEEFARLRGIRMEFYYLLLLCLVALTVVLLIQIVGLILVIALLVLPAAIAQQFVHSLQRIIIIATLLGVLFTFFGLAISFQPDLPAGATIILLAGVSYLATVLGTGFLRRR
jgi:zinc transport system permease protein